MNNQEYENKKRECWEEFKQLGGQGWEGKKDIFDFAFDRAYALGKVKDLISQDEIDEAAENYVSFKKGGKCYPSYIVERACCCAFKDGANFVLGKQEKDTDTVLQGWVCRDKEWDKVLFASDLYLSMEYPTREEWAGTWRGMGAYIPLNTELFPDLTWESEPEQVEIVINRKKK